MKTHSMFLKKRTNALCLYENNCQLENYREYDDLHNIVFSYSMWLSEYIYIYGEAVYVLSGF